MADQYSAPKGTSDLIGPSARGWEYLLDCAQEVFGRFGYEPIYTPIFEHTEVFTRGIGEATDVVGKEMYTFFDKGNRSITLRPENTASVVRAAINGSLTANGSGAKLYYAGPMFRYERPQKGRQRQFYQIGAEALGYSTPTTDAEMIIMLYTYFVTLGIPQDSMRLLVNSMGDDACRPAYRDKVATFIRSHSADLCEECNRRAETNPLRAFDCKNPACSAVLEAAPRLSDELCDECSTHYRQVLDLLDAQNIPYQEDAKLVRGLDYYTRTVFEIQVDNGLGSQNAIGGGGRYDGLFEALGGKPTPGIGFALGAERSLLALEAAGVKVGADNAADVYVACADDALRNKAFEITMSLRDAGLRVMCDLQDKSLKAQLKQADKYQVNHTVFVAPDEDAQSGVNLRDMSTKEETFVSYDLIADRLKSL